MKRLVVYIVNVDEDFGAAKLLAEEEDENMMN
jgi:hypothetical protein